MLINFIKSNGSASRQSHADCRQTYAAKHRHAWGDCEGGMVVPPSRSIHAKMGTISKVPILAFQAVDTLSTAQTVDKLMRQSIDTHGGIVKGGW